MSFDVFLIPSSASPVGPAYDQQIVVASRAVGARSVSIEGGETSDGVPFETYGRGDGVMYALHGMSPNLCEIIFEAAKRTNSFVIATGDVKYAIKPKGISGRPPELNMPIKIAATPKALCVTLGQGYGMWAGYRDYVRKQVNPR